MNGLLGTKHAAFQVEYLRTRLKGNALEWYMRNVKRHDRPIKIWSLESVFEGLQKCFLNTLMHRQELNKLNTIKQGKQTGQELIHELTKYTGCMVQYPDDYLFKRQLLSTLRPSLQKEVLCRAGNRMVIFIFTVHVTSFLLFSNHTVYKTASLDRTPHSHIQQLR